MEQKGLAGPWSLKGKAGVSYKSGKDWLGQLPEQKQDVVQDMVQGKPEADYSVRSS